MKIRVLQEELDERLSVVRRAVPSRTTVPVMLTVLLRATEDGIEVAGAGGFANVTVRVDGRVERAGACAVPAKHFTDYVASLAGGMLALELDGSELSLVADTAQARFNVMPADQFPVLDERRSGPTDGAAELQLALSKVSAAASEEDTRPLLRGTLFRFTDGHLYLGAADGYRMSRTYLRDVPVADQEIVLPPQAVDLLLHMDPEGAVTLCPDERRFVAHNERMVIGCSLVDGKFPDLERIFSGKPLDAYAHGITLAARDLRRAVEREMVFAKGADNFVIFIVDGDGVDVRARDQVGTGHSQVAAEVAGGEVEFGMNGKLVVEFLKVVESDRVQVLLDSPTHPTLWREVGGDPDFRHVIMPMSVKRR